MIWLHLSNASNCLQGLLLVDYLSHILKDPRKQYFRTDSNRMLSEHMQISSLRAQMFQLASEVGRESWSGNASQSNTTPHEQLYPNLLHVPLVPPLVV